ncbi:HEXXH motif domain-containing protein [Nonomuraea endophytica]|uniref:HEXXH motif domain-containing protein n=1 Tax=Nonomuraea endophytica TaxID=714136 RepID=UPI0037CAAB5C
MNLKHHVIPDEHFLALAAGEGGARAARLLLDAQYSKHLLLVAGLAEDAAEAYRLLSEAQRHRPEAVEAVLRHPAVGAWAWRTYHARVTGSDGHSAARLAAVAAAAAIRSGMDFEVELPTEAGGLVLPSLGRAVLDDPFVMVRRVRGGPAEVIGDDTVRIPADPHQDAPGWQALRYLEAEAQGRTLRLCVDDLDPYRMPGARLAADRLSAAELIVWQEALRQAWDLLLTHHRTVAEEVSVATRVLTPLTHIPGDQISGSSREAFGCIALSTPPDATTLALTFAHEVQHGKLAALLDVIPLLRPSAGRRYYAPWRNDPRPLGGLFQGAYAYIGVSGFWRRQRRHEQGAAALAASAEFYRWREAADGATRVIAESGFLTPSGERFVARMAATLDAWRDEEVSAEAVEKAHQDAEAHRQTWEARNGTVTPSTPGGVTVPG